jgi:hypothetical protein
VHMDNNQPSTNKACLHCQQQSPQYWGNAVQCRILLLDDK